MGSAEYFEINDGILLKYNGNEKEIRLPDEITQIGGSAFKSSKAESVIFGSNVKNIAPLAFFDCRYLKNVCLNESLESIGFSAFRGCVSLSEIMIPSGVEQIQWRAFEGCRKLKKIIFGEKIKTIGKSAFENCSSLSVISFPSTLENIEKGAFENCSALTTADIPDSVSSIGEWAFSGCVSLKKVRLPNSLTRLQARTFCGCSDLTEIELPESIQEIGWEAFLGCISLENIIFPSSLRRIEEGAFECCSKLKISNVPLGVEYIGRAAFKGSGAEKINKDDFVILADGILYDYKGMEQTVKIPESVKKIGAAFYASPYLKEVIIPKSVVAIDEKAFEGCCNLEKAHIGGGLISLSRNAFARCASLKQIIFNDNLKIISEGAFSYCSSLKEVQLPKNLRVIGPRAFEGCRALFSADIPYRTEFIGYRAFAFDENLKNVRLPDSIKTLQEAAFSDLELTFYSENEEKSVYIPPYEKSEKILEMVQTPDKAFDFSRFDGEAFSSIKSVQSAVRTAIYRLKNPFELSDDHKNNYEIFLKENSEAALDEIFRSNDLDALGILSEANIFTIENIDIYILRASKQAKTDILAYLLDYKNQLLEESDTGFELGGGDVRFANLSDLDNDDETDTEKIWDYTLENDGITLSRYLSADTHIITPAQIKGKSVRRIGAYCFSNLKQLKSVRVANGVVSIGMGAFKGCISLNTVKLPSSIDDIADNAFDGFKGIISAPEGSYAYEYGLSLSDRRKDQT